MKFRLRNKELQKKLDALSGDFSAKLNNHYQTRIFKSEPFEFIYFGGIVDKNGNVQDRFSAKFRDCEIESVPEYDHNKWNEWPAVTPPKNVLMRLEVQLYGDETNKIGYGPMTMRECARFDGNGWILFEGNNIEEKALKNRIVRFRPWLSPYEEEKE